jgi:hypothetical protein
MSDPGSPTLGRRLLAELLGSALLAALVIGSGIAAHELSPVIVPHRAAADAGQA